MNKFTEKLQRLFVSLAHVLAFGSFIYVIVMGTLYFKDLKPDQVSFLQAVLVAQGAYFAIKLKDIIDTFRGGRQ